MANPGLLLKGAKMLSKTPAGKKAKKKVADMYQKTRSRVQQSTSNSTVKDPLTGAMTRQKLGSGFSQGVQIGAEIAKNQVKKQGVKAAAAGFGVGLASGMFGNKKKK